MNQGCVMNRFHRIGGRKRFRHIGSQDRFHSSRNSDIGLPSKNVKKRNQNDGEM